ncbi:hypothetical protein [Schaalia dentiphila]|jgi:hypothetical protein|uniref:Uncharacterized protein n=1 Tax=Schaalia dentiphila ATCC 17982 TaxID=411466 RepID=A7BB27_9ACTO|nr:MULTISPECIES: hypothetical protein [Schaalia]EDN80401.1 hypothetical protein ACTODO_00844 [Schaalia odontolytica ATCC 17982]
MSDTTQDLEQWDPNEDETIIVPLEDDYALVVGPNTKGLEKIDGSLVGTVRSTISSRQLVREPH